MQRYEPPYNPLCAQCMGYECHGAECARTETADGLLALGLRHVFEACRAGCAGSSKMLEFSRSALAEFAPRLGEWPAYCLHFMSLGHVLSKHEPELFLIIR